MLRTVRSLPNQVFSESAFTSEVDMHLVGEEKGLLACQTAKFSGYELPAGIEERLVQRTEQVALEEHL